MIRQRMALVLLGGLLASCQGAGSLGASMAGGASGSAGGELAGRCSGDFGADAKAQKLEAFLSATAAFTAGAAELEGTLITNCREMGAKLGLSDAEMAPTSENDPPVRAACNAVAAKLRAELTDLRAEGRLRLEVVAVPPKCQVSLDAYASCAAECDATIEPGQLDLECRGGEIVGRCSGECSGSCSVEVTGQCEGRCEGSCQGGCEGTCNGTCEGTCSSTGADGQCNGTCEGTCRGSCSAGCQGECSGSCVVEGSAQCSGECSGECSVEFEAPRCTGTVVPPRVEADCQASCDAKINASAECTPGEVRVVVTGAVDGNLQEKLERVRGAIESGYGAIQAVAVKLERLAASGKVMVETAAAVPGAVASLGLSAGACATQAAAMLPRATASVSVSVEVSASLSGAVGS